MSSMWSFLIATSFLYPIANGLANKSIEYYHEHLYSSSVQELQKLMELENQFMSRVEAYADELQEKVKTLQVFLKFHARPPIEDYKERVKYVSNPVKAFALIRRIRQDWITLQMYIVSMQYSDIFQELKTILSNKPKPRDMISALIGLDRIETTYGLKATDMAQGRLQNKQYNQGLSQRDCLVIGNHNYENKNFSKAAIWYHIALKSKLEPNSELYNEVLGKPTIGVRPKFARAAQQHAALIRNPSRDSTELQVEVDKVIAKTSSIDLEYYVREQLAEDTQKLIDEKMILQPEATFSNLGCRGKFSKATNLSCRYNYTTSPFLRLAPLKLEEISRDPYIVMYHNVLSDREIDEMRNLTVDMDNGLSIPLRRNLTKVPEIIARTKVLQEPSPFRDRIRKRIEDMTGFDLHELPGLLLINYGMGTRFQPHYDFADGDRVRVEDLGGFGDRLASVIIYASDVELGGSTVFPDIQISVKPQKGNALVWYNIFDDETPDFRSLHSVCPVIAGSRWTITKWIHYVPQMFIKPCAPRPTVVE